MSEYQYYGFQAIDGLLSARDIAKLRSISSRAKISSTQFSNEYHYGDLKADPEKLLGRYFDLHVYVASWGTRKLAVRLPSKEIELSEITPYCVEDAIEASVIGQHIVLSFLSDEEPDAWEDGEGWMDSLLEIRTLLLQGDKRPLYLAWLSQVMSYNLEAAEVEPIIPPGLQELSGPLKTLVEFLRIDTHLLAAAAENSPDKPNDISKLPDWVNTQNTAYKNELLLRVAQGEHVAVASELMRRFHLEHPLPEDSKVQRRTVQELEAIALARREQSARAEAAKQEEERQKQKEAEAVLKEKRLALLAPRQAKAWIEVAQLIELKTKKDYDAAVSLLEDLHDLALDEGTKPSFSKQLTALAKLHSRKVNFIERLNRKNLLGSFK